MQCLFYLYEQMNWKKNQEFHICYFTSSNSSGRNPDALFNILGSNSKQDRPFLCKFIAGYPNRSSDLTQAGEVAISQAMAQESGLLRAGIVAFSLIFSLCPPFFLQCLILSVSWQPTVASLFHSISVPLSASKGLCFLYLKTKSKLSISHENSKVLDRYINRKRYKQN